MCTLHARCMHAPLASDAHAHSPPVGLHAIRTTTRTHACPQTSEKEMLRKELGADGGKQLAGVSEEVRGGRGGGEGGHTRSPR